jgi:hypothetical protein
MGMGSDEWNKGYFSYGPHHSHDARQGAWAREQERVREAQAREERARAARDREVLASMRQGFTLPAPGWQQYTAYPASSAEPATFGGTVRSMAMLGCVLGLAYAYFVLQLAAVAALGRWAIAGVAAGAAAGVALYAVILVCRALFAVLVIVLRVALWAGLVIGALYLLANMG